MKKIQITDKTYDKMIHLRSLLWIKGLCSDILEREVVIDFAITTLLQGLETIPTPVVEIPEEPKLDTQEDVLDYVSAVVNDDFTQKEFELIGDPRKLDSDLISPEQYFKE